MKKLPILVVMLLFILVTLLGTVSAQLVPEGLIEITSVEEQTITITTTDKGLEVTEEVELHNIGDENITYIQFWIQRDAQSVQITAVDLILPEISGNYYGINLTLNDMELTPGESISFDLTYTLPTAVENFKKTTSYKTTSLTIEFDNRQLYHGELLGVKSSLDIVLYTPTEAPLSTTYIIIVFILVIILIASTLLLLRKQRTRVKKSIIESEELLATKKALLLTILKDIEKQHRAKTLSDDAYTKLKEEYKHQAVEVMKKLDDLKK